MSGCSYQVWVQTGNLRVRVTHLPVWTRKFQLPSSLERSISFFVKFHRECSSTLWDMVFTKTNIDDLLWPPEPNKIISRGGGLMNIPCQFHPELFKSFVRYHGNKICLDEQTNRADRQPQKHNAIVDTVGCTDIKTDPQHGTAFEIWSHQTHQTDTQWFARLNIQRFICRATALGLFPSTSAWRSRISWTASIQYCSHAPQKSHLTW